MESRVLESTSESRGSQGNGMCKGGGRYDAEGGVVVMGKRKNEEEESWMGASRFGKTRADTDTGTHARVDLRGCGMQQHTTARAAPLGLVKTERTEDCIVGTASHCRAVAAEHDKVTTAGRFLCMHCALCPWCEWMRASGQADGQTGRQADRAAWAGAGGGAVLAPDC